VIVEDTVTHGGDGGRDGGAGSAATGPASQAMSSATRLHSKRRMITV
jgi:hypothetical protein